MALRFEGAVWAAASLPPPPPGSVCVLSQTLSPGASRAYAACTARWRAQQAAAKRGSGAAAAAAAASWVSISSSLGDCLADESAVLKALRAHLGLPRARERRACERRALR
jgi:hypothetical protein